MKVTSPLLGLALVVVLIAAVAQRGLSQIVVTPPPVTSAIATPGPTYSVIPGQPVPGQPTPTPNLADATTPKPYSSSEFPDWANKLRRFEVVSLGTFPVTFLVSSVVFQVGRWAYLSVSNDPTAANYVPFSTANTLTQDETFKELGIALGFSLSLGLIDFLIESGKPTPAPAPP
jgi:hypothetical protein